MKSLLIGLLAVAGLVSAEEPQSTTTEEETLAAIELLEGKAYWLLKHVKENQALFEELTAERPTHVAVTCSTASDDPDFPFFDPDWRGPDAPQRAHDAGFESIFAASYGGDLCGDLVITRDNFRIRGSESSPPRFENLAILGADNVRFSDIQAKHLEMRSSDSVSSDQFVLESARILNSNLNIGFGSLNNATIIDSSVSIGESSWLEGDIVAINSYVDLLAVRIRGRLIARGSTYIDMTLDAYGLPDSKGAYFQPGASLICDAQTSRVYAPYGIDVLPYFQPAEGAGGLSCLITDAYE